MRHWKRSGFVGEALCTLFLCAFLAGCGGGSHSVAIGPVVTISLAPVAISLNAGDVLQLQVSALDANKRSVFNQTITFTSSNPGIQVSNTGLLCAGTWDSLTTPINCKAATPPATTTVTASAQGKTSNVVPVNVHLPITSLTAIPSTNLCVSQGGAVTYTARALNGSTDITSTVGAFAWSIDSSSVGSLANVTTLGSAAATNTATAKLPGVTQVHVSANNANIVTGIPAIFSECPVASITVTPSGTTTLSATQTKQFTATVVDTQNAAVANLPITWSSSQPASVTVTSAGLATAVAAGTSSIVASCAPTNCNLGFNQPIFSSPPNSLVTVSGSAPATTVYATCNPCSGQTPAFPLVPISTSTNTAGTAISLPQQPLSLTFNSAGTKAYLGSANGLMVFDSATNTVTGTVSNAPGRVLAISPDGNQIITSSGDATTAGALFVFNQSANSVTGFGQITNAVSADFSPNSAKAFVVEAPIAPSANSSLFVVQPGVTPSPIPIGSPATGVGFLASGQVAYIAASGVPFVQTCNNAVTPGPGGSAVPVLVKSLPDGSQMLGAETTNLDSIAVSSLSTAGCPATLSPNTFNQHALGAATTPQQIIVTPDSQHAYITGSLAGSLPAYSSSTGIVSLLTLSNSSATTSTGGATLDSSAVYVGGSDSKVHIINVSSGVESSSVPLTFVPELVAIKP